MIDFSLYKQMLDNMMSSVVLLDERLYLSYMNPAAESLLAATQRRLAKYRIDEWLSSHPEDIAALQSSLKTGQPYTKREAKLRTMGIEEITVDYSVTPVDVAQNGQQTMLLIEIQARDRLLRIEREEELMAHHLANKQLVRGMAHEIKNPLGGIRGAAQLLQKQLLDTSLHDYTHIIIEEVDRLKNLVDGLLGSHKLPTFEAVNIHAVLERVCALVAVESAGSVALVRDYDPSLPELMGDSEQLIQAVLNIVRNAVYSLNSSQQDRAEIKLRTRAVRQVTLGAEKHRLVCCVEIIDNGPGVPKEILKSIFYPMVSGRADGSGVGLSVAQSVLNQHQGLIECSSEPGNTCFSLFIPLTKRV